MKYKQEDGILLCTETGQTITVTCKMPQNDHEVIAPENIGIAFFYSPYFQAASKYFSLKVPVGEHQDEYWGMLYPIAMFDESNTILYGELKCYQQSMLFSAFCKFIDFAVSKGKINILDGLEYHYADFSVSDSYYVCIYDRSVFDNLGKTICSFYDKGFYFVENPYEQIKFYRSLYQETFLNSPPKSLMLNFPSPIFDGFKYLDSMYNQLLPYVESPFFRYLILYQIVEYLMEVKKNEVLFSNIEGFAMKSKNDIREDLQSSLKDERLIELLYTGIRHNSGIYSDFCDRAKTLFENVGKQLPKQKNYIPYMYGVRNIIVHNFKTAIENEELVKDLSEIFEKIIYELLLSVKIDKVEDKSLFVWSKSLSYKENKRLFYKLYHK